MKTVGIIPTRLESSRLPRKALLDICGLPMIVHVLKRTSFSKLLDDVYVATDSNEISDIVQENNGKVIMTGQHHNNGTERIAEAAEKIDAEIVVNIQGDEALVNPNHIDQAVKILLDDEKVNVGLLVNKYYKKGIHSDIKAVLDNDNNVLYLSRNDIPSVSRKKDFPKLKAYHIVPFRKEFLIKYSKWEKSYLEKIEFNEYLRILERGYKIKAKEVESDAISVDTSSDLEYVRGAMIKDPWYLKYKT